MDKATRAGRISIEGKVKGIEKEDQMVE